MRIVIPHAVSNDVDIVVRARGFPGNSSRGSAVLSAREHADAVPEARRAAVEALHATCRAPVQSRARRCPRAPLPPAFRPCLLQLQSLEFFQVSFHCPCCRFPQRRAGDGCRLLSVLRLTGVTAGNDAVAPGLCHRISYLMEVGASLATASFWLFPKLLELRFPDVFLRRNQLRHQLCRIRVVT
jgi:hypothetical protein